MHQAPRMVVGIAVFIAGTLVPAQSLHLSTGPLRVGGGFDLHVAGGPPAALWHVAFDASPGPVNIPGVGQVSLGFTPAMLVIAGMAFDGSGAGGFTGAVHGNPSYVGNLVHAQAACADPASPTGSRLSNPLTRGFHPPLAVPVSSQAVALGEDSALTAFLPFGAPFPFFGGSHSQVGISSNGLLSFGGSCIDPTEQISDLIAGLPKIAVLWDDLSPQVAGEIVVGSGPGFFQVSFRDIPQFYVLDDNSGSATLYADGTITLSWPSVDLADSLVGLSPGGWNSNWIHEDFTRPSAAGQGTAALFEHFQPGTHAFDLDHSQITFLRMPGGGYRWVR